MKTKRIIAYILTVILLAGLLAGCKKSTKKSSSKKPGTQVTEDEEVIESGDATESNKPTESKKPSVPNNATEPNENIIPTNPPVEPDCQHVPKEWVMAATCTAEGARMQRCELCDYVLSSEKIPVQDHATEWLVEKEATCKEEGAMYQQCKDCKEIFMHIQTEKAPHTPQYIAGNPIVKCEDCGAVLPQTGTDTPGDKTNTSTKVEENN